MPIRGLTLGPSGQLMRDGARFRNIGLNYGGAIVPIYTQANPAGITYTSAAEQNAMLDVCDALKVKVLRVKATPFWPNQWRYGVNAGIAGVSAATADRQAYYAKIDEFVARCRARNIGVILTLFFRLPSVSDLAGQAPRAGWLVPGSATRNYAQSVTQEIVTRYLAEDAVYGYEFSNELNHYNDASDATKGGYPSTSVTYGSLASYPAATSIFNGDELAGLLAWWHGLVKAIDPNRIALTGNGPNSYSMPGGAAGISSPMIEWHKEQVRDNPTNCGSIHYYGNIGYGSIGFRGLNAVLTGVRHWQQTAGRGFVLGEFGNQPWRMTNISTSGGVVTFTTEGAFPAEVGDRISACGTGTALDDQWVTVTSINVARTSVTAAYAGNVAWSGSVRSLRSIDGGKLTRMCNDIIESGTDVALWWMIDSDVGRPVGESINEAGNEELRAAILAANTRLGW